MAHLGLQVTIQVTIGELQGQHLPLPPVLAESLLRQEYAPLPMARFAFFLPRSNQLHAAVCLRLQVEPFAECSCLLQRRLTKPLIRVD